MRKLEKVIISHNFNFRLHLPILDCGGVFLSLQEQFAENTNKSYHVCKVIIVLLIYHKMFGIK